MKDFLCTQICTSLRWGQCLIPKVKHNALQPSEGWLKLATFTSFLSPNVLSSGAMKGAGDPSGGMGTGERLPNPQAGGCGTAVTFFLSGGPPSPPALLGVRYCQCRSSRVCRSPVSMLPCGKGEVWCL